MVPLRTNAITSSLQDKKFPEWGLFGHITSRHRSAVRVPTPNTGT